MSRHTLTRRGLMSATGAGLLLVPLLNARRAWAATPTPPRRIVIMQATDGVMSSWWPTGSGSNFKLSSQMSPLAPHQSDLIVFRGMGFQVQMATPNGGVGHQSLPFLLTGKGAQGTNGGGPCAIAGGISVDQFIANAQQSGSSPPPIKSLELGAVYQDGESNQRSISYNGPPAGNSPAENPPEINPVNVFNRLQPLSMGVGAAAAAVATLNAQRKSVLDLVGGDLQALSKRLGTDDQQLLNAHLASVRQLETELQSGTSKSCGFQPVDPGVPLQDPGNRAGLDAILRAQLKLVTAAFACDATRVVTLMMMGPHDNEICFPWLGSEFPSQSGALVQDHHGIAHAAGDDGPDGPRKAKIDQWYMQLLADFITGLKNTPDIGGGTLFDNTVVVWMNNMGNGAAHNVDSVPIVLAGGGWYFKTGQYVQLNNAPHNGLLVSMANALGAPTQTFGDPSYGGENAIWKA